MKEKYMLNFDLKQEALDNYYDGPNANAYKDIRAFLESNGFSWNQGSGYISDEPMTRADLYTLNYMMAYEFPWFAESFSHYTASKVVADLDMAKEFAEINLVAQSAHKLKNKYGSIEKGIQHIKCAEMTNQNSR